jgi:catechol 2,3-dioxygenase-like lactoylglutathione lyase family enzyme
VKEDPMLAHLSLGVSDIEASARFYDAVLKPLGYARVMEEHGGIGYGVPDRPVFWLNAVDGRIPAAPGTHVAFLAHSRPAVDAFHRAGLAGGGTDDGGPGLRPRYHANYYAAFIVDPDGHRLEAVCHKRSEQQPKG